MKQVLTILALIVSITYSLAQTASRPNIIFIFSDDHAYQAISAYNSKLVQTPNIDLLAKSGALFQYTFITNSICGPSRAALLTGKYSHINGYKENGKSFDTSNLVFPQLLQQNGYQTAWIGKWHLGSLPKGFDYWSILPGQGHYYNPDFINMQNDTSRIDGYVTEIITKLSTNWLDSRDPSKPFFLVVGEKATHRQWLPDFQDLGAYDNQSFTLPSSFNDSYKGRLAAQDQDMTISKTMILDVDLKVHAKYDQHTELKRLTALQRRLVYDYYENKVSKEFDAQKPTGEALDQWKYQRYLKDYFATGKSLDRNIGVLLNYLQQKSLDKNTVVIYASDQGFYLGEHGWFDKRFMYEESFRTPFVIRYPGVTKPNSIVSQFALNIDWAPTILDITKTPIPSDVQGVSLLPLLKGNKEVTNWRKEVYYHYYEYPQPHHVHPHFGIRTQHYKLIRFYGEKNSWELFDLQSDPQELNNIYGSAAQRTNIADLKNRLKELIVQYKDKEAAGILEKEKQPAKKIK